MSKYFKTPFAESGDKSTIPDASQPNGDVSYEDGWTPDYAKDQTTDANAKDVSRQSENSFKFDVTDALKELQEEGFRSYDPVVNYPVGSITPAADGNLYKCLIENGPLTDVVDPIGDITKTWVLIATPQVDARHCIQSIGNGITFSGMNITIASDIDNPFMSTLADGFLNGQKNYQTVLYEDTNLVFTEGDGSYTFSIDYLGNFTFEVVRPDFDSTPGVMKSSVKKLPLGDVTVAGGVITVLDLMPVGDYYDVDWFLVGVNTNYPFDNRFQDPNVTFKAYWNSSQSEEGKYIVPHMYTSNLGGAGAALQTSTLTLNILTGAYATFYFNGGGAPSINETAGYYSFTVKRGF